MLKHILVNQFIGFKQRFQKSDQDFFWTKKKNESTGKGVVCLRTIASGGGGGGEARAFVFNQPHIDILNEQVVRFFF